MADDDDDDDDEDSESGSGGVAGGELQADFVAKAVLLYLRQGWAAPTPLLRRCIGVRKLRAQQRAFGLRGMLALCTAVGTTWQSTLVDALRPLYGALCGVTEYNMTASARTTPYATVGLRHHHLKVLCVGLSVAVCVVTPCFAARATSFALLHPWPRLWKAPTWQRRSKCSSTCSDCTVSSPRS